MSKQLPGSLLWMICCFSLTMLTGCGKPKASTAVQPTQTVSKELAIDLNGKLQKPADLLVAAREVISLVETSRTPNEGMVELSEAQRTELQAFLNLSKEEIADISRTQFSSAGLDTPYLAECLLLRDALEGLRISGLSPLRQVEIAFEWVGRQVILQDRIVPLSPVWYILQRGTGNALERSYVFLAAMQQLGFDAFLIGPPSLKDKPSLEITGNNRFKVAPFWGVGVRIDQEVYLFNPASNHPFPGPKEKGIATISQMVSDPSLVESWLSAKPPLLPGTKEQYAQVSLFLTPPRLSLAPRMSLLEKQLQVNGVKLYGDFLNRKERIQKEILSSEPMKKVELHAWNVLGDRFNPTRILGEFLPTELGGYARTARGEGNVYNTYLSDVLRMDLFPQLNLQDLGMARQALGSIFRDKLQRLFLFGANNPRERVIRGLLNDAIPMLTAEKDRIEADRVRVARDANLERDVDLWCQEIDKLFARINRAQRTKNQDDLDAATRQQTELLSDPRKSQPIESFMVRETARIQSAEATYLLALTVHEQAERNQIRLEVGGNADLQAATRDSWKNARGWWERYLQNYPELEGVFRERNAHAKQLLARCETFIKTSSEKK